MKMAKNSSKEQGVMSAASVFKAIDNVLKKPGYEFAPVSQRLPSAAECKAKIKSLYAEIGAALEGL